MTVLSVLVLALPLTVVQDSGGTSDDDSGRHSLEDLLREAEKERAAQLAKLSPKVASIVVQMDELRAPVRTSVSDDLQSSLAAIGPEAGPLLVPFLEPGDEPSRTAIFRSELVAEVLAGLGTSTVTDALLDVARTGTVVGRANALDVLGASPEPERSLDAIVRIAKGEFDAGIEEEQLAFVREAAFAAIAQIGTPEANEFVRKTLTGSDLERASAALRALESSPVESSADTVLAVLRTDAAARLAGAIAVYYESHEELLEDFDHSELVGDVSVQESIEPETRIDLFDLLRQSDARIGTPAKRRVDDYTESARSDVRNAALLLLARLGDRGARRELQREHDTRVETSGSIPAYSDRATLLHEIGEYDDAVRDWRAVLELLEQNPGFRRQRGPFVGIARSLARQKRYRDARKYLEIAPISLEQLVELGKERDFRGMRDSRYGDIFRGRD
ncbi:MAG: hypothetical protein AAF726_20010 [Planctomycetota bacterium]